MSIFTFKIDSSKCENRAVTWLEDLDFDLKRWLEARSQLVGTTFLSTRKTKSLAILDVVKNFNFDLNYTLHPNDLSKLPGLNKSLMVLTQFEQSVQMAKTQINSNGNSKPTILKTSKPKAGTFRDKLLSNLNKKPTASIIHGSSGKKVGIHQTDVYLYFRILKGGDTSEITKLLKAKNSISEVSFIKLTEAKTFSSFQLRVKVDVGNAEFWKNQNFWPAGCTVGVWKGRPDIGEKDDFQKRILISNIRSGVSAGMVESKIREIFPKVEFLNLTCGKISGGAVIVSMKFNRENYSSFRSVGLRLNKWPAGIKVRFLRKNFSRTSLVQNWSSETGIQEQMVPEVMRCENRFESLPVEDTLEVPEEFGDGESEEVSEVDARCGLACFRCKEILPVAVSVSKDGGRFTFFCEKCQKPDLPCVIHTPNEGEAEKLAVASYDEEVKCFVCDRFACKILQYQDLDGEIVDQVGLGCFCENCSPSVWKNQFM